jgi:predicted nucleic acid-binding protein
MIVIADTTPLNYLILINHADVLPQLFGRVLIPPAVFEELQQPETPQPVQAWIARPPAWLQVRSLRYRPDRGLEYLDPGEREAIALAEEIQADQLLLDEAEARRESSAAQVAIHRHLGRVARSRPAGDRGSPDHPRSIAGDYLLPRPPVDPLAAAGRR